MTTEGVVDAFMHPLFERMRGGSEGWQSYLLILTQLAQTNRWLDLLHGNFDPTAELFISKLRLTLPDMPAPVLLRGFALALAGMLQALSRNRRIDALSGGTVTADDLDSAYRVLLTFVVKGLEGLSDLDAPKKPRIRKL